MPSKMKTSRITLEQGPDGRFIQKQKNSTASSSLTTTTNSSPLDTPETIAWALEDANKDLRAEEAKQQFLLVLLWSGPEPWFEPDFWSGSLWFGPWFSHQPELDQKSVLGSRSSGMVPFWFGTPELFRTVNFAIIYFNVIIV
jgi:hypothetical protein